MDLFEPDLVFSDIRLDGRMESFAVHKKGDYPVNSGPHGIVCLGYDNVVRKKDLPVVKEDDLGTAVRNRADFKLNFQFSEKILGFFGAFQNNVCLRNFNIMYEHIAQLSQRDNGSNTVRIQQIHAF